MGNAVQQLVMKRSTSLRSLLTVDQAYLKMRKALDSQDQSFFADTIKGKLSSAGFSLLLRGPRDAGIVFQGVFVEGDKSTHVVVRTFMHYIGYVFLVLFPVAFAWAEYSHHGSPFRTLGIACTIFIGVYLLLLWNYTSEHSTVMGWLEEVLEVPKDPPNQAL